MTRNKLASLVRTETIDLGKYLASLPQFKHLHIEARTNEVYPGRIYIRTMRYELAPPAYSITVTYKARAELGRYVYIYCNALKLFDRESLVAILFRDVITDRLGVDRTGNRWVTTDNWLNTALIGGHEQ